MLLEISGEITLERMNGWSQSKNTLGEGNGNPLQYSCLENPMDGGAWWATVHEVAKNRRRLSNLTSDEKGTTGVCEMIDSRSS